MVKGLQFPAIPGLSVVFGHIVSLFEAFFNRESERQDKFEGVIFKNYRRSVPDAVKIHCFKLRE
jgi:hypothetical protein